MNKGNIKLSLVSFIFAATVLGNSAQVGAAEGKWECSYAGNPKNVAIDREGECVFKKL